MRKFILILAILVMASSLLVSVAQAENHNICPSCLFPCSEKCGPDACPCDMEETGSDEAKEACICITDDEKEDAGFVPASIDDSDAGSDDAVVKEDNEAEPDDGTDDAEAEPIVGTDDAGDEGEEDSAISPVVIGGAAAGAGLLAVGIGFAMRRRKDEENNPS